MYWTGERLVDDISTEGQQAVSNQQIIEGIKGVQNSKRAS